MNENTLQPVGRLAPTVPTSLQTIVRWIQLGVKARDGSRIRLRAEKRGGKWYTCELWLAEFFSSQTVDSLGDVVRTPGEREQASRRAEAVLVAAGC